MSFSIFLLSSNLGTELLPEEPYLDCPNGLRIRIGLSGRQGIDMPDMIAHSRSSSSPGLRSVVQKSASEKPPSGLWPSHEPSRSNPKVSAYAGEAPV